MKWLAVLLAVLALVLPARAHRLDEYLQATRIAITPGQIELRIDLTPGVAIVRELLPWLDPDGNGRFSRPERSAYAQRVLGDLHLALDGRPTLIKLVRVAFPSHSEMIAGEGLIHLTVRAKIPKLKPGFHEIFFHNNHLPKLSVYLVNALLPENRQIGITRQVRDESQREYRLQFEVRAHPSAAL